VNLEQVEQLRENKKNCSLKKKKQE